MQDKSQLKIIVASGNEGKIAEIKQILRDFEVVSMKEIGICVDPQESADNFLGNALIKATALQDSLIKHGYEEFLVLADDSGICIEALDDEPGIFSARYANIEKGILTDLTNGAIIPIEPLPPVMIKLLNDGGLVEHIKKNGDFNLTD